jgi:hypothetical protein
LTLLDQALQIAERTGELNRHDGQLLLQRPPRNGIAKPWASPGSRGQLWELRAAVSLARLRRDQDRPAEARELLVSIYG